MSSKFFKIFNFLFPRADAFSFSIITKPFVNFIKGLASVPADFRNYLDTLYLQLFPYTTSELSKWEEEFGIAFPALNDDDRRMNLDTNWKAKGGQAAGYIQSVLNNSGFDVLVHENNPPADPDVFLNSIPFMVCGGLAAYAGNDLAFAGKTGGDLLVNGPVLSSIPLYLSICGQTEMVCGNDIAKSGYFLKFGTKDKIYEITDDPDLWGAFFFIGGEATRNATTHELEFIEKVDIPAERKNEFLRLILKIKPAQTWAGLLINYV